MMRNAWGYRKGLERCESDDANQIANTIAERLTPALMEQAKAHGSPIIIIRNIAININYASGGGATVNVQCKGCGK